MSYRSKNPLILSMICEWVIDHDLLTMSGDNIYSSGIEDWTYVLSPSAPRLPNITKALFGVRLPLTDDDKLLLRSHRFARLFSRSEMGGHERGLGHERIEALEVRVWEERTYRGTRAKETDSFVEISGAIWRQCCADKAMDKEARRNERPHRNAWDGGWLNKL